MTYVDWSIRGPELVTCNCDFGCPCQFNARPTYGHCRAAVAYQIDEGHFGEVNLDGTRFAGLFAWPGAIHEGRGELQPIVEERASPEQREAILRIMAGEETEPGATIFNVFSTVIDTVYDPLFRPIEFEADIEAREGHFSIPGVVEARGEPIRNPISGQPHRARINLPHGFEYTQAEVAATTTRTQEATIPLDWSQGHGHFAMLHLTPYGVVR